MNSRLRLVDSGLGVRTLDIGLHLSRATFPSLLSQGGCPRGLGSDWNWFSGSLTLGML